MSRKLERMHWIRHAAVRAALMADMPPCERWRLYRQALKSWKAGTSTAAVIGQIYKEAKNDTA